jgi:hypothetical protein
VRTGDLAGSTVWAVVVLILGFLGFIAFLVNAGRSEELQRLLLLVGQGFIGLVQIWIVYRSSLSTNKKVDSATDKLERVNGKVVELQETVNGNTPQPGSLPKADTGP